MRNDKLRAACLKRDFGICCCCGFRAHEAHHIIPLSMGGEDDLSNMVSMCTSDHHHAPNTKEEFDRYVSRGGVMLNFLVGSAIETCYKNKDFHDKNFGEVMKQIGTVINILRDLDINYGLEIHSIKESLEIRRGV